MHKVGKVVSIDGALRQPVAGREMAEQLHVVRARLPLLPAAAAAAAVRFAELLHGGGYGGLQREPRRLLLQHVHLLQLDEPLHSRAHGRLGPPHHTRSGAVTPMPHEQSCCQNNFGPANVDKIGLGLDSQYRRRSPTRPGGSLRPDRAAGHTRDRHLGGQGSGQLASIPAEISRQDHQRCCRRGYGGLGQSKLRPKDEAAAEASGSLTEVIYIRCQPHLELDLHTGAGMLRHHDLLARGSQLSLGSQPMSLTLAKKSSAWLTTGEPRASSSTPPSSATCSRLRITLQRGHHRLRPPFVAGLRAVAVGRRLALPPPLWP